jgi:hypothetical protein
MHAPEDFTAPESSSTKRRSAPGLLLDRFLGLLSLIALMGSASCAPALNQNWVQVETQHIRLRSNQGESAARKMALRLQGLRDVVHSSVLRCGFAEGKERIEVTSLTPREFRKIADRHVSGYFSPAPRNSMGRRADQIVLPGELGEADRQVFQHELAHQLITNCFPAAPIWLHEGIANFLETMQVSGGKLSIGFPRYLVSEYATSPSATLFRGQVIEQVPLVALPSPSTLVSMSMESFYAPPHKDERELLLKLRGNYAAAWGLVHFLQVGAEDLHAPFQRYLKQLMLGGDPSAAWQAELGGQPLDARLREYLLHKADGYLEQDYQPPAPPAPPTLRALTPMESELHLAWLWGFDDPKSRAEARIHAERALKYDQKSPDAELVVALTLLFEDETKEGLARLDAALARTPANAGLLSLWLLVAEDSGMKASLQGLAVERAAKLRAAASDPMHFTALARHELFLGHSEQALQDSQRSIQSGPHCSECWEVRAGTLANARRWPEAFAALRRAGHLVPHGAPERLAQLQNLRSEFEKFRTQHPEPPTAPRNSAPAAID